MTKTEHLQFLVLMIPTFLILVAAAVSMADLASPAAQETYSIAAPVDAAMAGTAVREDSPAQ
jgi:hypothetical protein